jgi:hypothetical protein
MNGGKAMHRLVPAATLLVLVDAACARPDWGTKGIHDSAAPTVADSDRLTRDVESANKQLRVMLAAFEARREKVEREGDIFYGFRYDDVLNPLVAPFKRRGRAALLALMQESRNPTWNVYQRCEMVTLALLAVEFSDDAPSYNTVVRMLIGLMDREQDKDAKRWILRHIIMIVEEGLFNWSSDLSEAVKTPPWYRRNRPDLYLSTGEVAWPAMTAAISEWWEAHGETLIGSAIAGMRKMRQPAR